MIYSQRQLREVFHYLFLDRLLKISDPKLYVLKGGVNLRFFYGSPRYSEDMDLDVLGGSVATLKKNGYKILEDPAFSRSLAAFGISELHINDPTKAKHTATTQRFRLNLVTDAGESYPTKVEFSRRETNDPHITEVVNPEIARIYRRLAFPCQHYPGEVAVVQKVRALAHRTEIQSRDVFDLYILWLGGYFSSDSMNILSVSDLTLAQSNLLSFSYKDYQGQVLDYLVPEDLARYGSEVLWNDICQKVFELLDTTS